MKKICPLIKKECLEHGCEWFVHLVGKNPQTGVQQDEWGCSIKWLPVLLVENADQTRKSTASTDKVANEVRNHHLTFFGALNEESKKRLMDAEVQHKKLENGE